MQFQLPGQLRGPECGPVMRQGIRLRKKLEPWFEQFSNNIVSELSIALRVDGSLGSFGPPGVENINNAAGRVECDLIIEDLDWKNLSDDEIYAIIRVRVIDAVIRTLAQFHIKPSRDELDAATREPGG